MVRHYLIANCRTAAVAMTHDAASYRHQMRMHRKQRPPKGPLADLFLNTGTEKRFDFVHSTSQSSPPPRLGGGVLKVKFEVEAFKCLLPHASHLPPPAAAPAAAVAAG